MKNKTKQNKNKNKKHKLKQNITNFFLSISVVLALVGYHLVNYPKV